MAGPTLSLALARDPSEAIAHASGALLQHARFDASDDPNLIDFSVSSTVGMGGRYVGDGRPLLLSIESPYFEGSTAEAVRQALGCVPTSLLVVSAMCNSPADHVVLAEVSSFLAQQLRALIVLDSYDPLPAHVVATGLRYLIASRSTIPRECSLVDHRVLQAWSHDRRFSLVK